MNTLGILVAGGPAPGINGVISAAVIEARKHNWRVLGFLDGWKWLTLGKAKYKELYIRDVSRIHMRGGSILRTSRQGYLGDPEQREHALNTLKELGVTHLLVIGGDGTAYSSYLVSQYARDWLRVVHVPKTIDNDLPLPKMRSTFGFQTARHVGCQIVEYLMEDAATMGRWYFIVTMGRRTGHLALEIGKAAGTTLTIIPEEFTPPLRLEVLVDILETSILKRLAMGKDHGVALLAEGLLGVLAEEDISRFRHLERDPSGHVRFSVLNLGEILAEEVKKRLQEKEIELTIVSKNLGYELRCAPPTSFDQAYTRTLGYGGFRLLHRGESGVLVHLSDQRIEAIPLASLLDETGEKIRIRPVDITSESYCVAREYMLVLRKRDVEEEEMCQKLLKLSKMSKEEFLARYGYLIERDLKLKCS